MNPELRDRLIALLGKLAHPVDDMDLCPCCSSWVDEFEHKPDCELAACLKELRSGPRAQLGDDLSLNELRRRWEPR